ncbi:MAG: RluA family pseudouridine synthase [Desulfobacteraceae bacterium]|nr:RluA family pseudouridine synthase [Desulfobacteraceae bacterium]
MPDRQSEHTFIVTGEEQGRRLDIYLSGVISDLSRSHFKKLIAEGMVLVNGSAAKPSHETRAGDEVRVRIPPPDSVGALVPRQMHLEILFEDDDLIILNKPPGLVVHPGAGNTEGTLVHGLLAHSPRLALQGAPLRPGIVHRLDKDTSGALVVAKSERAYLHLIDQFKTHGVRKEYLALVYGSPSALEGVISTLLGRHPTERKKIAVLHGRGREALTRWRVETDWGETALLRVIIETGRTHQIRVHLSHIGHPVVGDETYGGGKRRAKNVKSAPKREILLGADRQMLHAERLELIHPATGRAIVATAPLPDDFREILEELRKSV